jgi:hypothetical protein
MTEFTIKGGLGMLPEAQNNVCFLDIHKKSRQCQIKIGARIQV